MLIRLIVFVALLSIVLLIYRKIMSIKNTNHQPINSNPMKKCAQCGVHLPKDDAVQEGDLYFCSNDHLKRFLDQNLDD